MKVAFWNVCNQATREQILTGCAHLQRSGVDVFCLQEVPFGIDGMAKPLSADIAWELELSAHFEYTRRLHNVREPRIRGYGTAILSACGFRDITATTLSTSKTTYMTPAGSNRRVLLSARTEAAPDVAIAVAHLSYKLPLDIGRTSLWRERQALINGLRALQKNTDGVIFGGDINQPPEELDSGMLIAGLRRISLDDVPTFRSRHWYAGHTERVLDAVYVSEDMPATAGFGRFYHSDHRPWIVDIPLAA